MSKIGLALTGGGGKGAYQIGVWKALEELGVFCQIGAISGTSVGALNAVLMALFETLLFSSGVVKLYRFCRKWGMKWGMGDAHKL